MNTTLQYLNDHILAGLYWLASGYFHFMVHWLEWSTTLPVVFECLSCVMWMVFLGLTLRAPFTLPFAILRVIQTNMALRSRGKRTLKHNLDTYGGLGHLQDKVRL